MAASPYAAAIAARDYVAARKALDEAIEQGAGERAAVTARLAQMHVNRGVCNQKLGLVRQAVKVRDVQIQTAGTRQLRRRARAARNRASPPSPLWPPHAPPSPHHPHSTKTGL
jgi:hypothetical protein